MSCNIRKYKSAIEDRDSDALCLTAFVGAKGNRKSIQFTVGGKYCALSEAAVFDLIDVLNKRLNCIEGYSATDNERDDIEFKE